jgi:hypothetical protein
LNLFLDDTSVAQKAGARKKKAAKAKPYQSIFERRYTFPQRIFFWHFDVIWKFSPAEAAPMGYRCRSASITRPVLGSRKQWLVLDRPERPSWSGA